MKYWRLGAGGFVGYIIVDKPTDWALEVVPQPFIEIHDLYVHPLRRGRGWAGELMSKACAYADRRGLPLVLRACPYAKGTQHEPGKEYAELKRFYNSFGFRTVRAKPQNLTYDIPLDCMMVRRQI